MKRRGPGPTFKHPEGLLPMFQVEHGGNRTMLFIGNDYRLLKQRALLVYVDWEGGSGASNYLDL